MAGSLWIGPTRLGVVLLCATSLARAEPSDAELAAARDMFNESRTAEDAGRWDEALAKLQAVAHVKMTPQVRFHLGLCHENLGRLVEALNHFERARAEAEERGLRTVLTEAKKHASDVRARTAKLVLSLPLGVRDVRVEIDGQAVASVLLATPLLLDGGNHQIRATAPGLTFAKDVVLAERQVMRLEVDLVAATSRTADRPTALQPQSAAALTRKPPFASARDDPGRASQRSPPGGARSSGAPPVGWWLVGGGTAALAGAVASTLVWSRANATIDRVCPTHTECPVDLQNDSRRARTSGALALALGIAGGAALGTGIIVLFSGGSRAPENARISWGPWVTAEGAGTTGAVSW